VAKLVKALKKAVMYHKSRRAPGQLFQKLSHGEKVLQEEWYNKDGQLALSGRAVHGLPVKKVRDAPGRKFCNVVAICFREVGLE